MESNQMNLVIRLFSNQQCLEENPRNVASRPFHFDPKGGSRLSRTPNISRRPVRFHFSFRCQCVNCECAVKYLPWRVILYRVLKIHIFPLWIKNQNKTKHPDVYSASYPNPTTFRECPKRLTMPWLRTFLYVGFPLAIAEWNALLWRHFPRFCNTLRLSTRWFPFFRTFFLSVCWLKVASGCSVVDHLFVDIWSTSSSAFVRLDSSSTF